MNGESTSAPDDDPLGPVVESFLDRFRRGERPALTDLVARHPELAGPIRELIPALVELEDLGRSTGDFIPPPGYRTGSRETGSEAPSPERLGDYVILRRIGGGGMGVVFEAVRELLKSRVALKVMHPRFRADRDYLRRFHAEARLAAALHHTNIVGVFDYGEQDGVCYYAMQFIEGQPLDHVLADIRRLRDDRTHADGLLGSDAIFTIPGADATLAPSVAVRGLLTGRFAATTGTGEAAEATDPIGACDPAASGQVICRVGETHRHRESSSAEPGAKQPVGSDVSALGSSSLGGSGELRYFREIARVGGQVADALEYAHRRGVLHRDIKPSNLLLDALGNVWVTDFGLAKSEEAGDRSQSRELVGTLPYMAPERFRRMSDRRGDIYSLGATLYELLTLRPAFEDSDQIRLMEKIRNDRPTPPRQIDRTIPRDLETIVLKALAKDPKDRFGTAGELADELRRFVEGRPIRSRPVSVVEQFWRWCKRDPWLAGANVAATLLTTVLAVVAIVYRNQAEALRVERGRSDRSALDAYTAQARAGRFSRRPGQRFESLKAIERAAKLLDGLPPAPDTASRRETLRDLAIAAMALPDLEPTGQVITRPPGVIETAFDPAMAHYALRFRDGMISVRHVTGGQEIARLQARGDRDLPVFAFSPDGRFLAATHQPGHGLIVWDIERRAVSLYDPGPVHGGAAKFSPDGRQLVLVTEGRELLVYDLATGRQGGRWRLPGRGDLAFRPDGSQIAVIDSESNPAICRILDGETGRLVSWFPLRAIPGNVAWSPDGATLAMVDDQRIDLLDTATGIPRTALEGITTAGVRVAFHPAGTLLASGGREDKVRLWDTVSGRPLLTLTGRGRPEFSQDGRIVISLEDRLTTYQVDPALEYRTFAHASRQPISYGRPSVRHDGRVLAVGTDQGVVLWDLARGTELTILPIGEARHQMFETSGDLLTSGSMGVQRWPIRFDVGHGDFGIGPPNKLRLTAGSYGIAEDRSGRIVAKASQGYAFVATPERTIPVGPLNDCRSVAVSPDGIWLATGTHVESQGAQVWRISDLTKVAELPIDYGTGVEFSPDGKWLMTESAPCRLWEVGTWREVRRIGDSTGCFSHDGRLLMVQDAGRAIRLMETETGRTLARLESPDLCAVSGATFSPDGSRLVVTTNEGPALHVWDLRAIRKQLTTMGLDWDAPSYPDHDPAASSAPILAREQINVFEHLNAEANVLAQEGRWEEAAALFARSLTARAPEYAYLWFENAILRLSVGDAAGYHSSCRHMLDALPGNDEPQWLEYTAHACALAPDGPAERAQALQLAQRRASVLHTAWSDHVMGLSLYRDGRFAEAETQLLGSLDRHPGWDCHILDWLVLSMAQQRLGRPHEARRWLERAERWVAIRLSGRSGGVDRATAVHWSWRDGILLHMLLREARALIDAELPTLPEDPFAPAP